MKMVNIGKQADISNILKDLYASMPNYGFNTIYIYQYLIFRNVSHEDRREVLTNLYMLPGEVQAKQDYFKNWIDRFKNNYDIDVFCGQYWRYFCQFKNGSVDPNNCYKIYVPLDYDHIYSGVNMIFDFISSKNISHSSKVGKKIRFDDVVIRVNTENDCKMILDYINKNNYIKSGLIKGNSFAFSSNGVNVSYDGESSYNSYLSCIISKYLNDIYNDKSKDINDVSFESFSEYLKNMISNKEFVVDKDSSKCDRTLITNLIRLNLLSDNIDDYYKFMNLIHNNKARDSIIYGTSYDVSNIAEEKEYNPVDVFDEVILYFMLSYGNDGYLYINKFLKGEYGVLMDNKELYNKVISCGLDANMCCYIAKNNDISTNDDAIMYNYVRRVLLDHVVYSMKYKLGEQGLDNLNYYISNGEHRYITRTNNARKLVGTFNNMEMRSFLNDIGVNNIYDYFDMYCVEEKVGKFR